MQKLTRLLEDIAVKEIIGETDKNIVSLESDSRKAVKDGIFVAVRGVTTDGHKYIPVVASNHVAAIVCEEIPSTLIKGITYIRVENSAEALGLLASAWFGHPSSKIKLIASQAPTVKPLPPLSSTKWQDSKGSRPDSFPPSATTSKTLPFLPLTPLPTLLRSTPSSLIWSTPVATTPSWKYLLTPLNNTVSQDSDSPERFSPTSPVTISTIT